MLEIRIHGRGGQGAVTTGQILAMAAFYDGKESQTFPFFGVERAGAPVQSFVRIDNKKIHLRSQIYNPHLVLVLESSLMQAVDVTEGLKKGGTLLVNSNKNPGELKLGGGFEVHTVDATSIAFEIFKRPIVNTLILGSISAITGVVSLDALKRAIHEKFSYSKGTKITELNKKAVEEAYSRTK